MRRSIPVKRKKLNLEEDVLKKPTRVRSIMPISKEDIDYRNEKYPDKDLYLVILHVEDLGESRDTDASYYVKIPVFSNPEEELKYIQGSINMITKYLKNHNIIPLKFRHLSEGRFSILILGDSEDIETLNVGLHIIKKFDRIA